MTTATVYDFSTQKPVIPKSVAYADCIRAMAHPVAPGYMNGCNSGIAASLACLKYLRSDEYFDGGILQHIVFQFTKELQDTTSGPESDALRGKIVGVFTTLEKWLRFAAISAPTDDLRNATLQSIQASLQDAADGGPLRRWEEEQKTIRSEQAHQAARARWDKKQAFADTTTTIGEVQ